MAASLYDILTVENKQYYRINKDIIAEKDVPEEIRAVLTPDNVVDENGLFVVDEKLGEAQAPTEENLKEIAASKPVANKPKAGAEPADTQNQDEKNEEEDDDSTKDSETDDEPVIDGDSEDDQDDTAPEETSKPEPQAPAKPQRAATPEPVAQFRSKVPQSRPGMGFPRVNGKTVDLFDGKTPHTHLKLVDGVPVPLSAESFRSKSDYQIRQRLEELGINTINFEDIEQEQARNSVANSVAGNVDSLMLDEDESDDDPSPDQ